MTYRIPLQTVGRALVGLVGVIAFLAVANDPVNGEPPARWEVLVLGWLPAALFAACSVRAWRSGVLVGRDYVRVRNPLMTYTVDLGDAAGFEVGRTRIMNRPIARLRTNSGRQIGIESIRDTGPLFATDDVPEIVDRMNDTLRSMRGLDDPSA